MNELDVGAKHLQDNSCPRVASVLRLADRNRSTRLSMYGDGATLRGIDEALDYLIRADTAFRETPRLKPIQQLVARAVAELETGIHAFFSGFNGVLFDAMRSAMEVEFLLRDFLIWPSHVNDWFNFEAKERRKKFQPAKLRERYRGWIGGGPVDLQESKDYSLHSELLHVSPKRNLGGAPGLTSDDDLGQLRVCLAEITMHMGRIVTLVHRHWQGLTMDVRLTRETAPNLPLFEDAWSRSQLGAAMWVPQQIEGS